MKEQTKELVEALSSLVYFREPKIILNFNPSNLIL